MVLPDISYCLNLTIDIFNMKTSEKCQGFNSHSDLCSLAFHKSRTY